MHYFTSTHNDYFTFINTMIYEQYVEYEISLMYPVRTLVLCSLFWLLFSWLIWYNSPVPTYTTSTFSHIHGTSLSQQSVLYILLLPPVCILPSSVPSIRLANSTSLHMRMIISYHCEEFWWHSSIFYDLSILNVFILYLDSALGSSYHIL